MSMDQQITPRLKRQLIAWYFTGCFLVFGMVVVGGITRLTGSGLSITEWKVITGAIPPLTEHQWLEEFAKYQQIPQYREMNYDFTLADYKFIYFWEYIHRLFGRLIGVVFLGGFLYFYSKGVLKGKLLTRTAFMFVLGGIQGFLGWYMVSSGLTQNIRVSHIRLAIHLVFAFITFGYIFWVALTQLYPENKTRNKNSLQTWGKGLLIAVTIQIIYGAFVAGTKAGLIYNTWPQMGDTWMPESVGYAYVQSGLSSFINNLASVQFIHRMLAYLVTTWIVIMFVAVRKSITDMAIRNAATWLLGIILLQVILGISTLLLHVPVWLGVMHQAMAFFLFAGCIYFNYRLNSVKSLI